MEHSIVIDKLRLKDWDQVREIYLEGIATGNATFQKNSPSWDEWDKSHLQECRVVA